MEHVSSVRPTGKFPEKVENLNRWSRFPGWNFRTECRFLFTFLVVCTSSRSTVGHRHVPGFTTKWNNFLPIGNSTFATTEISGFFRKWKAPHIFNLRHTRVDFLRLKLGVISTAKRAHNQGASNERPKLYCKSYFARHFYAVLKLWVTGKCMCNIKSIGTFLLLYCFLENCRNLEHFHE